MRGRGWAGLVCLGVAAAAAGCGSGAAEAGAGAVPAVEIVTRDHEFEAPDTIAGGARTIRLVNEGPDFHHVWLVRLEAGGSEAALLEGLSAHAPLPEWAVAVGGPNTPGEPGGITEATVDLEPGDYMIVCVIPGMADGELHVSKGMVRRLTVIEPEAAVAMPVADLEMELDDYGYRLSGPLTGGRQSIRIVNVAAQPHEVVVVKLEPGRSAHDFLAFLQQPEGAPPGRMIGGVTWLSQGESNVITLDFEPGEYALLCFVPDETDGRLHLEHGMVAQVRVE
jgi:hypothetical protein